MSDLFEISIQSFKSLHLIEFSRRFEDGKLVVMVPDIQMESFGFTTFDITETGRSDAGNWCDTRRDLQTKFLHPYWIQGCPFHIGCLNIFRRKFISQAGGIG